MRILGPLIVVLVASAGISANGASFRDVASPDADIDELALKRERLREELRERAFARAEKEKEQYEEALNTGDMQGRLFGPAYHRKLGHRFDWPEQGSRPTHHNRPYLAGKTMHPHLNNDLRDLQQEQQQQQHDPIIEASQPQNPEQPAEKSKQTTVVKESTKPVAGDGDEKVINVEKVEPVHPEEEEKIPDGNLHPTPAYHRAREDLNRLNPLQNAANMADVYFLELKRDVLEKRSDPDPVTTESTPDPPVAAPLGAQKLAASNHVSNSALNKVVFIAVVAGCSVAGLVGLVVAGVCWYRLQKNVKAASEAEYPAYGITGPTKERVQSPGDRKLAQSAQMYHYQHQKQQMIALEKANSEMKQDGSDEDSEEENEEGDYTVYECPGLAPTGEMEVKNPLFSEDTPVTPTAPGNK